MTAETFDEMRLMFGHQIQRVAQVEAGNGATGSSEQSVAARGKSDGRSKEPIFES